MSAAPVPATTPQSVPLRVDSPYPYPPIWGDALFKQARSVSRWGWLPDDLARRHVPAGLKCDWVVFRRASVGELGSALDIVHSSVTQFAAAKANAQAKGRVSRSQVHRRIAGFRDARWLAPDPPTPSGPKPGARKILASRSAGATLVSDLMRQLFGPAGALVYGLVLRHARSGRGCYASVDTLAAESGQSRRTVHRHLRRLESEGWIGRLSEVSLRLLGLPVETRSFVPLAHPKLCSTSSAFDTPTGHPFGTINKVSGQSKKRELASAPIPQQQRADQPPDDASERVPEDDEPWRPIAREIPDDDVKALGQEFCRTAPTIRHSETALTYVRGIPVPGTATARRCLGAGRVWVPDLTAREAIEYFRYRLQTGQRPRSFGLVFEWFHKDSTQLRTFVERCRSRCGTVAYEQQQLSSDADASYVKHDPKNVEKPAQPPEYEATLRASAELPGVDEHDERFLLAFRRHLGDVSLKNG